jgi:putative transposase
MPRQRRPIFPGVPHHVTQRGNHRERVFLDRGDPEAYLSLLHAYSRRHELEIFAYCLMPNHVHLVVRPGNADGMHRALRAVHSQYAQRVNRMRMISGHLWQGRYNSCALDANHFLNAIRYVELNPVKARLTRIAEDYAWSSAAAHCGRRLDPLLKPVESSSLLRGIADWAKWLAEGVPGECLENLRRNTRGNLPCGTEEFVAALEKSAGRSLRFRPRGGQPKTRRAKS